MTKIYKDNEAIKLIQSYIRRGKEVPKYIYYSLKDYWNDDEFRKIFADYTIDYLDSMPEIEFSNEFYKRKDIIAARTARKYQMKLRKFNARNINFDGTIRVYVSEEKTESHSYYVTINVIPKAPGYHFNLGGYSESYVEFNIYNDSDSIIRTKVYNFVKDLTWHTKEGYNEDETNRVKLVMGKIDKIKNTIINEGLPIAQ